MTRVVVGVGCSLGCAADELLALVDGTLAEAGLEPRAVEVLATVDRRAEEPGVVEAARRRGWPLVTHAAAALRAVGVPTPSATVEAHVGTPSVAEAAALLSAGADELLVPKRRSARATCAIARQPADAPAPASAADPAPDSARDPAPDPAPERTGARPQDARA